MGIAMGFPAQNSQTPAHLAAYGGGVSTLKVLVERGANLDIQDKVGLDFSVCPVSPCVHTYWRDKSESAREIFLKTSCGHATPI
jgi:hypothetical protein